MARRLLVGSLLSIWVFSLVSGIPPPIVVKGGPPLKIPSALREFVGELCREDFFPDNPEAREALENVASSRLTAVAQSSQRKQLFLPDLELISNLGPTPECRRSVQQALVLIYSLDPSILSFPDLIAPNPNHSLETNVARAETIYLHSKCSSDFRRKDPRVVIEEHEAIARGTGRVECDKGVIIADGKEPWWQTVFGTRLAGLYATYGPFLSRKDGGTHFFTYWGDRVCEVLLERAERDPTPLIRSQAAKAFFLPIQTQRIVHGTNVNVVFLCPEGLVGERAVLARDFSQHQGEFFQPKLRAKLTVTGGSAELRQAAAYSVAKALADLQTLSELERTQGVGILSSKEVREVVEFLTNTEETGRASKEQLLEFLAVQGKTSEARLAGALALSLTWADMIKGQRSSGVLEALDQNHLIQYWSDSQSDEQKKAIIAPLTCLFAKRGEQVNSFTIQGQAIIGLPNLSC